MSFSGTEMKASLSNGKQISVPLDWFPRLNLAAKHERANWRLVGNGEGIHWPDLDEDISLEGLLVERRSAETPKSIQAWVSDRQEASSFLPRRVHKDT